MSTNRIRVFLGCILVVLAVSAVASASASAAAPEFFHCVKTEKTKDEYPTKEACVKNEKKGEEPREWDRIAVAAGSKIKFTDKEGVSHFYATSAKGVLITYTCEKDTSKGEITGPKTTGGVTVTFTGCTAKEDEKESCSAKSAGEPAGTIKTNALKDTLGAVAKAEAPNTATGDALEPEGKEGFVTLEASCIEVKTVQVSGSVIGEVKPVKVMQTGGELLFECETPKSEKQKIQRFEGGVKDTLSAFGNPACFESKDEVTYEEPIEVT